MSADASSSGSTFAAPDAPATPATPDAPDAPDAPSVPAVSGASPAPVSPSSASATAARRAPPPLWSDVEIETVTLLKAALPAHRALAACAEALIRTPLDAAALEAFSLLDAVGAVQLDGEPVDPHAALEAPAPQREATVVRQMTALGRARELGAPVGSTLALELAALIVGRDVSVRRGPADPGEGGRCPPPLPQGAERLQGRLERWQDFVQRDSGDLDPLLLCGIALAEWLAIRPFTGGNVRVGQLLVQLMMVEEELLPAPLLPLSLHASRRSDACWQALHASRLAGHPAAWLRFFLGAIEASARDTSARLAHWEAYCATLPGTLESLLPKRPSAGFLQLCARPSFGLADAIDTGLARRQTAAAWLTRLVEGGLLRERRAGKEKRYVNDAVVLLLLD